MPSLPELQDAFAAAVFRPQDDRIMPHIAAGQFPAQRLLSVYRNNMFASLEAALAAVYPVIAKLVGDGFFHYCATQYILAHPSRSGNLHDFGAAFAEFLAEFPAASALHYLPDVARLEWAWHRAFHAAERTPLAVARLVEVAEDDYPALRFALHPSARLLESAYPILRIVQVNQEDYRGDAGVDLNEGGDALLVIRRGTDIGIERLGRGEYALLSALADGACLADATAKACAAETDFDLSACLRHHVAAGSLVDFSLEQNTDVEETS